MCASFPTLSINLCWIGPFAGPDVFAEEPPEIVPRGLAGVYLHARKGAGGTVVSTYVGKSQGCILDRQGGHRTAIANGEYNIIGDGGMTIFKAFDPRPEDYLDEIAIPYIGDLDVYFAEVRHPLNRDKIIDAVEGLLIASPTRLAHRSVSLNNTKPTDHQVFKLLEAAHVGAAFPVELFGSQTIWDRTQWATII